jgi:rhodanese-related sulfurtransferase
LHLDPRSLRRLLAARFTSVRWIETAELARWLAEAPEPRPLLLDARTPDEYAVSHLPGARRVDPDATDLGELATEIAAPIVVYCSVGYRSAALCERLQESGHTDVRNLSGGIFQWANERRELRSGEQRATQVHPFSWLWGWWLRSQARGPIR